MNVLVLAAQSWDGTAVPCRFVVEADSAALDPVTVPVDAVRLPDGAGSVRIVATPTSPWFWDDEFHLVVTGDDVAPEANDLAKIAVWSATAVGVVLTRVTLTVSRLKDRSVRAREELFKPPNLRKGEPAKLPHVMDHADFPPPDWSLPDRPGTTFVDVQHPVDGARIGTVVLDAVGGDVECAVFEVAGVAVPKLLAVSWPIGLLRDEGSPPTPFLVYYHAGAGQNVDAGFYVNPELAAYPWNFDHCYFGLYAYQWYSVDPLTVSPFPKGIPFQIAAAGKEVVSVLPCNAPGGNEFGAFTDAAAMETLLLDLQALMFRRRGVVTGPQTLGRAAVGAFSSGNNFMAAFLQSPTNRAHRFCQVTLQEVYCFDPPGYITGALTAAALAWSEAPETGRRVVLYSQNAHAAHTKLLGHTPPPAPFVESSPDGTRTAAVLPAATWRATVEAATGKPQPTWGFQNTHQVISAMMLTHAMATSGFLAAPLGLTDPPDGGASSSLALRAGGGPWRHVPACGVPILRHCG